MQHAHFTNHAESSCSHACTNFARPYFGPLSPTGHWASDRFGEVVRGTSTSASATFDPEMGSATLHGKYPPAEMNSSASNDHTPRPHAFELFST